MAHIMAAEQAGASLAEYGIVGILVTVIVGVMGMLLRHILSQAEKDREMWIKQSERFVVALTGVTEQVHQTAVVLKETKAELAMLREEWREYRERNK
jgi:C4-dicarboxylate transporter